MKQLDRQLNLVLELKIKFMENIIKKAMQVGGWSPNEWDERVYNDSGEVRTCLLDSLFWQALGKACGWEVRKVELKLSEQMIKAVGRDPYFRSQQKVSYDRKTPNSWKINAMKFHEINLTQGWDKAVEWLEDLTK